MSSNSVLSFIFMLLFSPISFGKVPRGQNMEDEALFLTPYIEAGRIAEAQRLAEVKPMMKHVESFAGFLTVNKSTNSNMYFWLFKSQHGNWEERPLVIWLHGGPGYTSLIGLFGEVGPFFVSEPKSQVRKNKQNRKSTIGSKRLSNASATSSDGYRGLNIRVKPEVCTEPEVRVLPEVQMNPKMRAEPEIRMKAEVRHSKQKARIEPEMTDKQARHHRETELRPRKFAWNRKYNVLFIDNPVGAGFSFSDTELGYPQDLAAVTRDLYEALAQFYELFPSLKSNKLILAGDSYGMKFALAVSDKIRRLRSQVFVTNGSRSSRPVPVPASIVALSGWVDPTFSTRYASYLYNLGLLDRKQFRYYEPLEETVRAEMRSDNYLEAYRVWWQEMHGILNVTGLKTALNFIEDGEGGATWREPTLRFLNRTDVRRALHVGNHELKPNEAVRARMAGDWLRSTRPLLEDLLTAEVFPIMFLAGQVDVMNPYAFQSEMFAALEWPGAKEYRDARRCQFKVGSRVAAYFKTAGTFTEVLVRNTGHMIPCARPKWVYALLDTFITNVTNFRCNG